MYIEFEKLPGTSKVWVYQSTNPLSDDDVNKISASCESFVNEWTAHQQNLHASYKIFYNHFIVFGVDESVNSASGCSIDKKMHFINKLESQFNISLTDRMKVAFRSSDKHIEVCSMMEFAEIVHDHAINDDTIVFNNLVQTKDELETKWEIPLYDSWHLEYIEAIRD